MSQLCWKFSLLGYENQCDKIGKKRSYPRKSTETGSLSHDTDYDDDGEEMMRMKVKKRKEENVMESPTSPSLTLMVPVKTQLVYSTFKIKFTCKKNFNRHHSGKYPFKSIASMHDGAMKGKTNQNHQKVLPPPLMVRRELVEENFAKKSDPSIIKNDDQSEESPKQKSSPFIIWEDNPSETNKPPINNDTCLAPSYPNCDSASNKFSFFLQDGILPQKKRKQFKKSDPSIIKNDDQSEESPKQKSSPFIIWEDNPSETNKPPINNDTCLAPSYPNCDSASNKFSFFLQDGILPQKKRKQFKKSDPSIIKNDDQSEESPKQKSSPFIIWEDNPSETNKPPINNDTCLAPSYPNCDSASNKFSFFLQDGILPQKKRKQFKKSDPSIIKNDDQSEESPKQKSSPFIIWEDNPSETNKPPINNDTCLAPSYPNCDSASNKFSFFSQNNNYQCKRHINDLSYDPKINMLQPK